MLVVWSFDVDRGLWFLQVNIQEAIRLHEAGGE